jgi:hypothetical protein
LEIPTLLIIGDADIVRPEHTVELSGFWVEASRVTWSGYRKHSSPCFPVPPTKEC